ncbi:MAG: S-adenosylmethionine synthetase [Candidatus Diapherotrites archaeon]|nr:S-adenosylmethionine synthetase [Candidatus Diapherotrites archaeon]MDN5366796.1 S-adenosylmethionine synthetase [Candidatus Diapherotrites archaeon]
MAGKRNVVIDTVQAIPVEEQAVEIVERKGVGHPDSIADGIAEAVSRALCAEYVHLFGTVLHHNTDQVEVVGGRSRPMWGGGEVIKPIYILLSGRATSMVDGEWIPVHRIAIEAAKDFLWENFRHLDVESHVIIESKIGHGSVDLKHLFEQRKNGIPLANDTSLGVGYAPLTETEALTLETERFLNSDAFKREYPAVGEDIKVMAVRKNNKIELTIAAAMVDSELNNVQEYLETKAAIFETVRELAENITDKEVEIHVNTADDIENGVVYLTVTGLSAEAGDDGSVGRGNRVNGLITPARGMSLEAAAGKNPVNHVGKIYNVVANQIAKDIYENVSGVHEAYVYLLSRIGKPIDDPEIIHVKLLPEKGTKLKEVQPEAEEIVHKHLDNIMDVVDKLINGEIRVF